MPSALRFTIIGLMMLTAVGLALILYNLNHVPATQAANPVVQPLQASYLVAAHPLPAGTLIRDEDFKVGLASALPEGAIADTPDARIGLHGSLVRTFIDTGHPINAADVLRPRDRGFIASVLLPGTRAVAINVDPVSGVAGLIWPGDHVDVILTQEIEKVSIAHHTVSETVLTDIRIIAIDQEIVQGAPDNAGAGKTVHTVTLQVDAEQAEKLTVAIHLGKLALAIRSAKDGQVDSTAIRSTDGTNVSPALARMPPPTTLIIYDGDKRREVTFKVTGTDTTETPALPVVAQGGTLNVGQ